MRAGFSVRKFDGDDAYSWAVFRSEDVAGRKGPIFYGQATPMVCGCSRAEASYHKKRLTEMWGEKEHA